jgi:hypothetical protein
MKFWQAFTRVSLVGLFLFSCGCGRQPAVSQPSSGAAQPTVAQPTASQPIAPQFSVPAPPPEDRDSIAVEFVEVTKNDRGEFVVLRFTNTTNKTIAGIRGGVHVLDADGNIVRAYGYTSQLFNKAPAEYVDLPLLKIKPDGALRQHRDSLAELSYVYAAHEITFGDE